MLRNKIGDIIFVGILFSLFYSIRITNLLIILYTTNWLSSRTIWKTNAKDWLALLVISPWLFELISLLYTNDVFEGMKQIEKKIALFLFPFFILHGTTGISRQRDSVFYFVAASTILATFICLVVSISKGVDASSYTFYWYDFTKPINFHPSYLSLIINIVCLWFCQKLILNRNSFSILQKLSIFMALLYFGLITLLLASKIQTLIYFGIVTIGLIIYLKNKILHLGLVICSITCIIIGLIFHKGDLTKRFSSISSFHYQLNAPVSTFNELTIRFALIECSWMLIRENPVLGTGIGDVMNDLDAVYRKVDYKFGYLDQQDPHDQYLRVILGTGSVGLLLFFTSLAVPLWMSIKSKDYLLTWFLVIFGFSFLFESVLERHNGIIIFSILNAVLIFGQRSNVEVDSSLVGG